MDKINKVRLNKINTRFKLNKINTKFKVKFAISAGLAY